MRAMRSLACSAALALIVCMGHAPAPVLAQDTRDEPVQLNLVDTDIGGVLRMAARFTGRQFLVDPRVTGKMTVVSDGPVSRTQAYQLLLGALRMRGFAVVENGGVSRVVPQADAKLLGGRVGSGGAGGEIATRTFALRYENAAALVAVLRPMISPDNPISANPGNNTLVITDYADNLDRIARVIASVDTPAGMDTDVVKLQQGIAVDVAAMVSPLLDAQGAEPGQKVVVMADPRSNSVLLRSSSPGRTRLARQLVEKLDRAQDESGNLHVVYLRNAQANQLAGVLRGVVAGQSDAPAMGSNQGITPLPGDANRPTPTQTSQPQQAKPGGNAMESQRLDPSRGDPIDAGSTGFSQNGISVQADVATNTLLISAPEPVYRNLRRVIDQLDQRRAQVLVESLIVEVNQTDAAELGVQWMLGNGRTFGGTHFGGATGGSGLNTGARTTLDVLPKDGLKIGVIDGTINLPGVGQILNMKALATALQSKGGANILSTPNLMTLDNEAASIMVGQTVPFVSGRYVTDGGGGSNNPFQTIVREDVGLKLRVRPQISEGGTVKLDIYQEVSSIDAQSANSTAGIITNKRALDTSVLLDDGQIMVLGGLLEDSVSHGRDAVPGLGKIPVLGALFRSDTRKRAKTNLMVFLRPHVVRDPAAGQRLTRDRYDYMRNAQAGAQPVQSWALPALSAPQLPPQDLTVLGQGNARDGHGQPLQNTSLAALYPAGDGDAQLVQFAQGLEPSRASQVVAQVRALGLQAYAEATPGESGQRLRVRLPRDPVKLDPALQQLRGLGYTPELVIGP
ncbi:type II secretion system secretin GspD [Stenotrophomonas maltophilia]|uniref:type II secretion system secretin GspD n=1 Tax=Stenotrophomonas maltophilia group TaxID=995085 RepID=UPI0006AC342C|nr:type II secretion system secretin GspD [Stenotrophomonas maltophilia]KOQ62691.1 general secretion pathway protein GspD [Stenotrophomonas maltophilia]MBN7831231.1 type II secretion system secretin GspD [Stenotrophomonas maltophilia]MBN7832706.1 type II secretion system secretin GspD [Stenotrophomonas maltophilia]MBN7859559.1 type II secretion system secretin GspD [Stenotrophomonas maltophilia]MBN7918793.1 type II secretion system secretin GspD [Stenotrophomonas maltophilia]